MDTTLLPTVSQLAAERGLSYEEAAELRTSMVLMDAMNTLLEASNTNVSRRGQGTYINSFNVAKPKELQIKEAAKVCYCQDPPGATPFIAARVATRQRLAKDAPRVEIPFNLIANTQPPIPSKQAPQYEDIDLPALNRSLSNTTQDDKTLVDQAPVRRKAVPVYKLGSLSQSQGEPQENTRGHGLAAIVVPMVNNELRPRSTSLPKDTPGITPGQWISGPKYKDHDPVISRRTGSNVMLADFSLRHYIGGGSQGQVYLATHLNNESVLYAVKAVEKTTLNDDDLARAFREQAILKELRGNQFIINLQASFQDSRYLYLVTPYYGGKDIQQLLFMHGTFTFERILFYTAEIILALEFLHSHELHHQDLKLANLLLTDDGHVVLADFGLADRTTNVKTSFCGTIPFMPPEALLGRSSGKPGDIWGLGVCIWGMRTGCLPWFDEDDDDDLTETKLGIINDPVPEPGEIEPALYDLCRAIFEKNPLDRPICSALRSHSVFGILDWGAIERRELTAPYLHDSYDGSILAAGTLPKEYQFVPGEVVAVHDEYRFSALNFPPPLETRRNASLRRLPSPRDLVASRPTLSSIILDAADSIEASCDSFVSVDVITSTPPNNAVGIF